MQNHQPHNFNTPLTLQQQQYYYNQSQYLNATNATASSMPAYPLSSSHARNRGETTAAANYALPSSHLSSCFYPTTTTANVYHPSSLSHQQYHSSSYDHHQNNSYPLPTTAANCFPNQQQMMQQQHQQMQGFGIPPPPPPPPPRPRPGITANITTNKTSKITSVTTTTSSILPIGNNCHISETNNNTTKEKQQQQHHCDACNISFPTAQALSAHIHSHITCTKCSFSASKKVVSAHYKAKHGQYAGRGLKTVSIQVPGSRIVQRFKICVGNHPDDIQAWIEERKRRFPTRENVANKMQKRKRFREEGAVVDDGTLEVNRKRHVEKMGEENVEGGETTNGNVQETKNDAAMEEKVDEERKCFPDPSTLNSITSLVAGYGSSSDEEDGKNHNVESTDTVTTVLHDKNVALQTESATMSPNAVCNTTNSTIDDQVNNIASKYKTKQCRYFLRNGTCKNGDSCTYIHDMEQHENYKMNADARKERQSQKDRARNQAKKEMSFLTSGRKDGGSSSLGSGVGGQTLLRKLLENDIRRERSLCLQLLRYIVDCNYLQERRDVKEEQEHDDL